jgi:DNA-binding transcriptional MerR regulator
MTQMPEKLYFKIGEVSQLTKVKPYVLRYWESEFKIISPRKSTGNQRVYTRKDIESILLIKRLLGNDRFTLEGAKKKLKDFQKDNTKQLTLPLSDRQYQSALKNIRKELKSIKKMLAAPY